MKTKTIIMASDAALVTRTAMAVAEQGAKAGLDEKACFQVQVVMAEVLNNIISYAASNNQPNSVMIFCQADDDYFEIITRDCGKPLDRLPSHQFPPADIEGGRGWPIIFNWMDSIEYRSHAGENELTLRKDLN